MTTHNLTAYGTFNLLDKTLHKYTFNVDGSDSGTGTLRNLTNNGSVAISAGKLGNCSAPDGVNGYWSYPDSDDFEVAGGDFTVCGWIYFASAIANWAPILTKSSTDGSSMFNIFWHSAAPNPATIAFNLGNNISYFHISDAFPIGQWVFFWFRRIGSGTNNVQMGWTTASAGTFSTTPEAQATLTGSNYGVNTGEFQVNGMTAQTSTKSTAKWDQLIFCKGYGFSNAELTALYNLGVGTEAISDYPVWSNNGLLGRCTELNGSTNCWYAADNEDFRINSSSPFTICGWVYKNDISTNPKFEGIWNKMSSAWKFNDNLSDYRNGYTLSANPTATYVAGKFSKCVSFNGTSDVVYKDLVGGETTFLTGANATWCGWVWHNNTGATDEVIFHQGDSFNSYPAVSLYINSSDKLVYRYHTGSGIGSFTNLTSTPSFPIGEWVFVWVRHIGSSVEAGWLRETDNFDMTSKVSGAGYIYEPSYEQSFSMGAAWLWPANTWGVFFDGKIDNVIYCAKQYISNNEMQLLFNNGSGFVPDSTTPQTFLSKAVPGGINQLEMFVKDSGNFSTSNFSIGCGATYGYDLSPFPVNQWVFVWMRKRWGTDGLCTVVEAGYTSSLKKKFSGGGPNITISSKNAIGANSAPLTLGAQPTLSGFNYFLNGKLDQWMFIKNYYMPDFELESLYNKGIGTESMIGSTTSSLVSPMTGTNTLLSTSTDEIYLTEQYGLKMLTGGVKVGSLLGISAEALAANTIYFGKYSVYVDCIVSKVVFKVQACTVSQPLKFAVYSHTDTESGHPFKKIAESEEYIIKGSNAQGDADTTFEVKLLQPLALKAGDKVWIGWVSNVGLTPMDCVPNGADTVLRGQAYALPYPHYPEYFSAQGSVHQCPTIALI